MTQFDVHLKCNSVISTLLVGLAAHPLGLLTIDDTPQSVDPKRVRVLSGDAKREICAVISFEDGRGGTQVSVLFGAKRRADATLIEALIAGLEAQARAARYYRGPVGFRPRVAEPRRVAAPDAQAANAPGLLTTRGRGFGH